MRRTLVLFAVSLLLWVLVTQLNHTLAGWSVHVFAGGLFVVSAALTQPPGAGLASAILAGLVCDAHAPVAFGLHAGLFAAAQVLLFQARERLPRGDALALTVVALLANLVLFVAFTLARLRGLPAPAALWPRLAVDLAASQLAVALAAPWFAALQARALALARVPRFDLA
jgi:hypothetical protein